LIGSQDRLEPELAARAGEGFRLLRQALGRAAEIDFGVGNSGTGKSIENPAGNYSLSGKRGRGQKHQ